jgi:hypothetical protein
MKNTSGGPTMDYATFFALIASLIAIIAALIALNRWIQKLPPDHPLYRYRKIAPRILVGVVIVLLVGGIVRYFLPIYVATTFYSNYYEGHVADMTNAICPSDQNSFITGVLKGIASVANATGEVNGSITSETLNGAEVQLIGQITQNGQNTPINVTVQLQADGLGWCVHPTFDLII